MKNSLQAVESKSKGQQQPDGPGRVLVIEDEPTVARNVVVYLAARNWEVESVTSAEEGIGRIAELQPDVVLLDFGLPGISGLAALPILLKLSPRSRVVMLTGQGHIGVAVDAMKAGAADYLEKPSSLAEIEGVLAGLVAERVPMEPVDAGSLDALLGASTEIHQLKALIRRLATVVPRDGECPPSVLIQGETGSGKELVARALHTEGPRRDKPFIEINCAAIPAALIESELFGHERGAFTDAQAAKSGLVELAQGGTLFLDEIGELDIALQAKLLRFLDGHAFRRVGGTKDVRVDVRVIAATNRSLSAAVTEGRFRADLRHRLQVLRIDVPPLRDRKGDIAILAEHFLAQSLKRYSLSSYALTAAALAKLESHRWPGNVRELRNVIEQAVLMARRGEIEPQDIVLDSLEREAPVQGTAEVELSPDDRSLSDVERAIIEHALLESDWNISRASRLLRVSRPTLRYRITRHGLDRANIKRIKP